MDPRSELPSNATVLPVFATVAPFSRSTLKRHGGKNSIEILFELKNCTRAGS